MRRTPAPRGRRLALCHVLLPRQCPGGSQRVPITPPPTSISSGVSMRISPALKMMPAPPCASSSPSCTASGGLRCECLGQRRRWDAFDLGSRSHTPGAAAAHRPRVTECYSLTTNATPGMEKQYLPLAWDEPTVSGTEPGRPG